MALLGKLLHGRFPEACQQTQEPVLQVLGLPGPAALPHAFEQGIHEAMYVLGAGNRRIQPQAGGPPGEFLAEEMLRLFHEWGQRNRQVQEPSGGGDRMMFLARPLEKDTMISHGHAQVAHAVIVASGHHEGDVVLEGLAHTVEVTAMRPVAQQQAGQLHEFDPVAFLPLAQLDHFHPVVLKGLGELVEVGTIDPLVGGHAWKKWGT